jgi:predicted O-methyltransferase YrrM
MPNIKKALTVEGWMEPPELLWLAEAASTHKRIVEIGSYLGRSTRALLDNTSGFVVAIDDWHGPREIEIANRHTIYERFLANTSDCKNLVIIKANHRELPEPEFQPDMVFIDGAHEYDAVCADIAKWKPHIAPGGMICGHDFGWFAGVDNAVRHFFPNFQVAPNTSIWFQVID